MEVKQGDIAFSGKRAWNFYSRSVMKLTGSKWSHSFFLLGDVMGELSVLEADLKCQVVPWQREYVEKDADYYEVFRPIKASQEDIERAAKFCYHEYSGEMYGFLSIPWFMWRIFAGKFLHTKPQKNWSTSGIICSEELFDFIYQLGGEYRAMLNGYGPDITSPQDLYDMAVMHPDLFQFVTRRV